MELSRAEVTALLHVEAFGQRRKPGSSAAKLASIFQNDLRPAIVFFDLSSNVDNPAGKLSDIAEILHVIRKHNYAEPAQSVVFAKIQIMDPTIPRLNANNFSGDTALFANMFLGLIKRNAFREGKAGEQQDGRQYQRNSDHRQILG